MGTVTSSSKKISPWVPSTGLTHSVPSVNCAGLGEEPTLEVLWFSSCARNLCEVLDKMSPYKTVSLQLEQIKSLGSGSYIKYSKCYLLNLGNGYRGIQYIIHYIQRYSLHFSVSLNIFIKIHPKVNSNLKLIPKKSTCS